MMSSTILHSPEPNPPAQVQVSVLPQGGADGLLPVASDPGGKLAKNPFLVGLGERVRVLRSRRGMTRKTLAAARAFAAGG